MFVASPSDDQTAKRCPTDAGARRNWSMNAMVWSIASGSESFMVSAVRTMARGAQSLAEEEFQHRAGMQARLFAS